MNKSLKITKTFGAEIEKPVSSLKNFQSAAVSQAFFKRLKKEADKRSVKNHYHFSDIKPKIILGVVSDDLGEQGLDNSFNLLETSLPYQISLTNLYQKLLLDLQTTQQSLLKEETSIINMSIHPLGKRDMRTYKKMVAPKGLYKYIWYRGWDHTAGIDARAQNSPTTGISAYQAADAVSAIIGCGAAFIALFANGPFEEGKISPLKDARLNMWDRMTGSSKVKGDLLTTKFPPQRFKTLAQYFNWMFGSKTQIYFILARNSQSSGYKSIEDKILIPQGHLSVLEYLSKKEWPAFWFKQINRKNPKKEIISPNISDLEVLQYTQFAGARIRFKLKNHNSFPIKDFLKACRENSLEVEKIFDDFSDYFYIEGRDPGANFPDKEIISAGENIAKSTVISPSAIQAGLLNNLKKVVQFIDQFKWNQLKALRDSAIKNGLQGKIAKITVEEFTSKVLELANEGLDEKERWMLAYPKWVLQTKQNGADRALRFIKTHKKGGVDAIVDLVKYRRVLYET